MSSFLCIDIVGSVKTADVVFHPLRQLSLWDYWIESCKSWRGLTSPVIMGHQKIFRMSSIHAAICLGSLPSASEYQQTAHDGHLSSQQRQEACYLSSLGATT
eukprot:5148376-Amphidinium_carterae.1